MPQWDRIQDFRAIQDEFFQRAHTVVWCDVATVDAKGRPTSRILHTIWEQWPSGDAPVGWIATRPTSPKARDLGGNPFVSLAYVQDIAKPLYVECEASWANSLHAKQHLWDLFASAAPPLGYDPVPIFGSSDATDFGALRLTPWRIQLGDSTGTRRTWLR
jgi:hypothetical protein